MGNNDPRLGARVQALEDLVRRLGLTGEPVGAGYLLTSEALGSARFELPVDVFSDTYTPVITNGSNTAVSSASLAMYWRIGDVGYAAGRFDIDPTLAATLTVFDLSLPIASNFAAVEDLSGIFVNGGIATGNAGEMHADIADNRAECAIVPTGAGNLSYLFQMSWRIL